MLKLLRYDLNQDGKLDKNEITKIIKYIYDFYGEDQSASDKAEMIIQKLGTVLCDLTFTYLFNLDKNGDNLITKQEFIEGCMMDECFKKLYDSGFLKVV
jgi:hypothetical protein